jgi:hypothetical protein
MLDIKDYLIAVKKITWGIRTQYSILIMNDRMIFVKIQEYNSFTASISTTLALIGAALVSIILVVIGPFSSDTSGLISAITRGAIGGFIGGTIGYIIGIIIANRKYRLQATNADVKIHQFNKLTEEQILKDNKDSFVIRNGEISSLKISGINSTLKFKKPQPGILTISLINGKSEFYNISIPLDFMDQINFLESIIPGKIQIN